MKRSLFATAILACTLALTSAETDAPAEIDFEERIASVAVLEQHIAQREARFEALRKEVRDLDARLEEQLDFIINTLAATTDSQDSRRRVAGMKQDVVQSLMRNIEFHRRMRRAVFERLRTNPGIPLELSEQQLNVLDERIGRRVDQITQLVQSMPGHRDVRRFETDSVVEYWNGWSYETTREREEWRQNRRDARSSESVRGEVLQRIDRELQTAERRRAAIAENLAGRQMDERERAAREGELGRLDAMIDNLRAHRREIALPGSGAENAIGRNEAHRLEQMLDDARNDMSRDFNEIVRRLRELDVEAVRIHEMRENLAARKLWLENNPPPGQ